ncbi:MAG TPA: ribonuclease H-like domain-containing protein [Anaerolineales bacterium]|nr:ribonuclease H-like domain-containing protein [Anaerolineales bacterium]
MPSLADRLKSLGVQVGAQNLPPRQAEYPFPIEKVVGGELLYTHFGPTYQVEERFPAGHLHGSLGLLTTSPMDALAAWTGDERVRNLDPRRIAFIDTETTGLSGGTGTYAFMIGIGRFIGDEFQTVQLFMRDPAEEPADLAALEEYLAPAQALVTFNGKTFDLPLLRTRFTTHGLKPSFSDLAHIDLLHISRRLWRDRLPSRTLGNLEYQILGAQRTEDDVPGWMIPSLYFDYLRSGDARPLRGVFYHNKIDVVSMAALLNCIASLLADPSGASLPDQSDLLAIAKFYDALGDAQAAAGLYHECLQRSLSETQQVEAMLRLAQIRKRAGEDAAAIALWKQAAFHWNLDAHIELAKAYEHRLREPRSALEWTQAAIQLVNHSDSTPFDKRTRLAELEYRQARLERKLAGKATLADETLNPAE